MATKLHGLLNLSKIDKKLITTNAKGEKCIWIDVVENYGNQPDQYGNTHAVVLYSKETGKIYLGNLKPQEFGSASQAQAPAAPAASAAPAPAKEPAKEDNDLPF